MESEWELSCVCFFFLVSVNVALNGCSSNATKSEQI